MADEVAKRLSIIFEKLWQFGEVPSYWKRGNTFKKGKKNTWGTTRQSHLCAWKDSGTDPPQAKACGN